jgi:hypothetical protein
MSAAVNSRNAIMRVPGFVIALVLLVVNAAAHASNLPGLRGYKQS